MGSNQPWNKTHEVLASDFDTIEMKNCCLHIFSLNFLHDERIKTQNEVRETSAEIRPY